MNWLLDLGAGDGLICRGAGLVDDGVADLLIDGGAALLDDSGADLPATARRLDFKGSTLDLLAKLLLLFLNLSASFSSGCTSTGNLSGRFTYESRNPERPDCWLLLLNLLIDFNLALKPNVVSSPLIGTASLLSNPMDSIASPVFSCSRLKSSFPKCVGVGLDWAPLNFLVAVLDACSWPPCAD